MVWPKLRAFAGKSVPDQLNAIKTAIYKLKGIWYYRAVFGSFGKGSVLFKPVLLSNPQYMHIGSNVSIRPGVRLEAVVTDRANPPQLHIGNNVNIEQDVHIVCLGSIRIADNVSITARCSLLCGFHPFLDVNDPVKIGDRLGGSKAVIEIGEGSFLGVGTVVAMNVRIGKRVVVGSNCVVKSNIPDFCVVDGNPAQVVMRYDFAAQRWLNLKK